MNIKKIPEDQVSRIPGIGKVMLIVQRQPGAELSDYLAYIRENGEQIDRGEPFDKRPPIDSRTPFDERPPIDSRTPFDRRPPIDSRTPFDERPPIDNGTPFDRRPPIDNGTPFDERPPIDSRAPFDERPPIDNGTPFDEKPPIDSGTPFDERPPITKEDKKDKSPLGKYVKRGMAVGIAVLLLFALATVKEKTHATSYIPSDYTSSVEVSDIALINIDGQYVQYSGSVYDDPGKLIHDMRDAAIGENNGTLEGIAEHFATTTDESRVAEEETILEISSKFQAQQRIIDESERILKSSASDIEKREALEKIIGAKRAIQTLYIENEDLYDMYTSLARGAYEKNGGDERTRQENELTYLGEMEYYLAIKNLGVDIMSLNSSIYTLDNPQRLFEEEPAPKGTVDTRYIIDTEILGHDIHIGEISSTEVTGLEYDPSITVNEGGTTVTNGQVLITEEAIQDTQTTRKGIFAVVDIIKRFIEGKETGEIEIFGQTVHDDPHIEDKE